MRCIGEIGCCRRAWRVCRQAKARIASREQYKAQRQERGNRARKALGNGPLGGHGAAPQSLQSSNMSNMSYVCLRPCAMGRTRIICAVMRQWTGFRHQTVEKYIPRRAVIALCGIDGGRKEIFHQGFMICVGRSTGAAWRVSPNLRAGEFPFTQPCSALNGAPLEVVGVIASAKLEVARHHSRPGLPCRRQGCASLIGLIRNDPLSPYSPCHRAFAPHPVGSDAGTGAG